MLALVNAERKATNDRKRIERELFDSLRRDKVDSIQKMQVGDWVAVDCTWLLIAHGWWFEGMQTWPTGQCLHGTYSAHATF